MRYASLVILVGLAASTCRAQTPDSRVYQNTLTRLKDPSPLLADHPEFVEPVKELDRYEAPVLVDDDKADLHVRAWRFSYNARGIIEMPNRLKAADTAVIMVHPWGIDDGQGWKTPEPAGVCDFCTLAKNKLGGRHTKEVISPFHKSLRGKVALVMYSLPGKEDPIRKKLYRSIRGKPTAAERQEGAKELKEKLASFDYKGEPLPRTIALSKDNPVRDYFRQFPGLDAGPQYNNAGFWDLPIPVTSDLETDPEDVVIYDGDGYGALRDFLKRQKVRHILLTGYATDMCFCRTTAGYENLSKDFNVFLVGDATLATFPANATPRFATNAHISYAALNQLVTQISWVKYQPSRSVTTPTDETFPAHRVIGNTYYVGSKLLATYLITTPDGHILINSGFDETVPLIRDSVESLGFKMSDVKILLASHAHSDHVAGHARLKELTGAKVFAMRGDAEVIASGGLGQYLYTDSRWKPCNVDRVLEDGDKVKLGDVTLVAHRTPGHTRGCTTWTWRVMDEGKQRDVVVIGSPNVNPGYRLVDNKSYPNIADDFARTFAALKALPCDVFLGAHGDYYGMAAKYERLKAAKKNPFIDPEGYRAYVEEREKAFRKVLAEQSKK